MAEPTALVWLKRDLRLRDHAPLAEAARFGRALAVHVVEPAWLASPEFHPQHWRFVRSALQALQGELAARGLPLLVVHGEVVATLAALQREHGITHLLSHEETGAGWTYERDKSAARWCQASGVRWMEFPQTGVVRRLRDRNGWAAAWERRMGAAEAVMPAGWRGIALKPGPLPALSRPQPSQPEYGATETDAWRTLRDFLGGRGRGYSAGLSSPLTAESACSRLSAHLAYGTISMRCVHQATEGAIQHGADRLLARDLARFASRLRWHCHFMQKLEDEPDIEFRNFARSHDGLRPGDGRPMTQRDQDRLEAWREGRTGFPMVDACMRQLRATGWLNFRMRAMLVSFASHHLWLHWREPGLHLARTFLDFEPGIHWSQMQMQSGTTGINTLRIYSPSKQALEHDPEGLYRRRWLPEWGTRAYPEPIVDERAAIAHAKETLYGLRRDVSAHAEAKAIQQRHGSRKAGLPQAGAKRARARRGAQAGLQQDLFSGD